MDSDIGFPKIPSPKNVGRVRKRKKSTLFSHIIIVIEIYLSKKYLDFTLYGGVALAPKITLKKG